MESISGPWAQYGKAVALANRVPSLVATRERGCSGSSRRLLAKSNPGFQRIQFFVQLLRGKRLSTAAEQISLYKTGKTKLMEGNSSVKWSGKRRWR